MSSVVSSPQLFETKLSCGPPQGLDDCACVSLPRLAHGCKELLTDAGLIDLEKVYFPDEDNVLRLVSNGEVQWVGKFSGHK